MPHEKTATASRPQTTRLVPEMPEHSPLPETTVPRKRKLPAPKPHESACLAAKPAVEPLPKPESSELAVCESSASAAPLAPTEPPASQPTASSHASTRTHSVEIAPVSPPDRGRPLPETYGLERLVAMARDPAWVFCYWELHGRTLLNLRALRSDAFLAACAWVLRLHRINEGIAVDLEISPSAGNWYLRTGKPGRYQLELGLLSSTGEWMPLLASTAFDMPNAVVSEQTDEQWTRSAFDLAALLPQQSCTKEPAAHSSGNPLSARALGRSVAPERTDFAVEPLGVRSPPSALETLGSSRVNSTLSSCDANRLEIPADLLAFESAAASGDVETRSNEPAAAVVRLPRVLHGAPLPSPTWPS